MQHNLKLQVGDIVAVRCRVIAASGSGISIQGLGGCTLSAPKLENVTLLERTDKAGDWGGPT
jgi:hypothetical protein